VVVDRRLWHKTVLANHPELVGELEAVLAAITRPARVEADPFYPDRRRFFALHGATVNWVAAVVDYRQQPPSLVTAALLAGGAPPALEGELPEGWLERATGHYDPTGDVLYLRLGEPTACTALRTGEGHILRFSADKGQLAGVTLIGVRAALEEVGNLPLTIPTKARLDAKVLRGFVGGDG